MTHRKKHRFGAVIMASALVLGAFSTGAGAALLGNPHTSVTNQSLADFNANTITIGWTPWADAKFMVHLVKQQIESHTKLNVYMAEAPIAVQYRAVANGDLDGMIMAWLPDTHKSYWEQYGKDVVDLGPMYKGAVLGWAVPDYVSADKVASMADLKKPAVANMFDHKVVGIDPGAGEMKLSAKALKDYGLSGEYTLTQGSESSMTQALARAVLEKKPIVVTLWTPHWAFGKWNLRFLKDPKGDLGGPQHIDAVVRKGFAKDHPKAAAFLKNLHIPLAELQDALFVARQTDEETAVNNFVKKHKDLVKSWWHADHEGSADAANNN